MYYEGLSSFEFENNDVFIMSPDQFSSVPEFGGDVCFVWLDSTSKNRMIRHSLEKRRYSFLDQDRIESENIKDFTERIYQNDVLYFNNEDTSRVAAILYCLVQHPELYDIFRENYSKTTPFKRNLQVNYNFNTVESKSTEFRPEVSIIRN